MILKNLNTLKALEKRKFITLHSHTGQKVWWNGQSFKTYYIEDYSQRTFSYNNRNFECKYVDGCFYPFVFEITNNKEN